MVTDRLHLMRPFGAFIDGDARSKAARAFAKRNGYSGARGGWIYNDRHKAVCQGWDSFYFTFRGRILNDLVREITAFESFDELTTRTLPSYRPTLRLETWKELLLADEYDRFMESRNDPRRAYVGFDRTSYSDWRQLQQALA